MHHVLTSNCLYLKLNEKLDEKTGLRIYNKEIEVNGVKLNILKAVSKKKALK